MGDALLSEDAEYTAGRFVVAGATKSSGVETLGRGAAGSKASAEGGPRKQLAKRKGIRNDLRPSAETLPNRYNFTGGLRRGLVQAANNNSPLPGRVQQQGPNQYDGADDTMPGQDVDHVDWSDAENIDEVPVERPAEIVQQQLMGDGKHAQSSTILNPNISKYRQKLYRGLLKAAKNGTRPSGWIQARGAAGLGDFWVRLYEEMLSEEPDPAKIKRMVGELGASEFQGGEAADGELPSAGEGVLEKGESSEQRRQPVDDEAEVEMRGRPDMDDDDSDDDVFVRRPRRRRRLLTRHHIEEEL